MIRIPETPKTRSPEPETQPRDILSYIPMLRPRQVNHNSAGRVKRRELTWHSGPGLLGVSKRYSAGFDFDREVKPQRHLSSSGLPQLSP